MFTVTIGELVGCIPTMRAIAQRTMNGATAIRIARLIREIDKEVKSFEEIRNSLFRQYGEVIDDKQIRIANDKQAQFNAEMNKALNEVVEINAERLTANMIETMQLTPVEVSSLLPFIE